MAWANPSGDGLPVQAAIYFFEQTPDNLRRFRRMSTELDMADFSRYIGPPGGHFGLISMARPRSDIKRVTRTLAAATAR
jgi:hypothetical protein